MFYLFLSSLQAAAAAAVAVTRTETTNSRQGFQRNNAKSKGTLSIITKNYHQSHQF